MTRRLTRFQAGLFVCLLLSLAPSLLHAQAGRGGQAEPAGQDASNTFLGLSPHYNSVVDINRTQTKWDQTFRIRRTEGVLLFDSNWKMGTQENSAQNDYRSRLGLIRNRLEYAVNELGGWSGGVDTKLQRNFSNSDFSRTVDNGEGADLFLTTNLLSTLLEPGLGLQEGSLTWTVTGLAGMTADMDTRQNKTSAGLTRSDSTDATGSTQGLESQLNYGTEGPWKLDASARLSRESQESYTERYTASTDSSEILDDTNENESRRYRLNSTWSPDSKTRVNFTAHYSRELNQYYSTLVQAKDTKEGVDQRIGFDAKGTPFWGMELTFKAENSFTDITYDVATQGRGKRKSLAQGKAKYTLGSAFGPLKGTELNSEYHWETTRNTSQSSSNYDYNYKKIRQGLRRQLTRKLVLLATGEGSLAQSIYDDLSNDRDEVRWLLDGALGYRPTKILDTRLTAQWQQRQTINIPAGNSRNSNTQNSYRIGAEVTAKLNPSLQVSQKYAITADYSFYDFNENNNGLVRTTEVRTQLKSTVGSKVKLDADHSYRFKDSGQYVRIEPREPRRYGRTTEEQYQNLSVTTRYDFTKEFDIHATQRMEVRTTTQVATGDEKRTEKLEFTGGVELNHQFSDEFSVNAKVDRTQSSTEDHYWRVIASVNRRF